MTEDGGGQAVWAIKYYSPFLFFQVHKMPVSFLTTCLLLSEYLFFFECFVCNFGLKFFSLHNVLKFDVCTSERNGGCIYCKKRVSILKFTRSI